MKNYLFYQNLPYFKSFNDLVSDENFSKVPEDWVVILTDVKGSTKAIADGKYREVNTIGAASIVVARKAMKEVDFPFVFGGDGATLLIPGSHADTVLKELCSLKALSKTNFGLDLRVGAIQITELLKENSGIEVAKYELTPGRYIAALRGDGVSLAEEKIKKQREKYEVEISTQIQPDLTGLSCRWQPIPSRNGKILTLLILARRNEKKIYQQVLDQFQDFFPEGIESLNPAMSPKGEYKSLWHCLKDEFRLHRTLGLSFFKRCFEIIISNYLFKFQVPIPVLRKYTLSMQAHSDFRKFDNMLRMVIDCSSNDCDRIQVYLESLYKKNDIFYGLLMSENSLMTCFVEGLGQGEHIHFIDAENGGYASAAVQLKAQMNSNLNFPA